MLPDTCYIYSDASFSKPHGIAFLGYGIFGSTKGHETLSLSEVEMKLFCVQETNNIRAELLSAIKALNDCPEGKNVILYTDCQNILNLTSRRPKLEQTNFMSQAKNQPLANADYYRDFYAAADRLNPELIWIKGHSPQRNLNRIGKNFSILDQAVRRGLRQAISEIIG